ncbi:MAG: translation initiation factor IF-3 [Clostridiales bacterium]|nr:translation initiation factor IF-3 [Clostridiales bacterium]
MEVYVIKKTEINEDIRDKEVRLLDVDGEMLGVVSRKDALNLAIEKKLDLVKIAPNAVPPVCKIMDYGKFKYEQAKKDKESKKKQKITQIKEIRLSLSIDDHDMKTKANNAIKFLESGDKVKVALRFKGRQMGHTEFGYEVINKFAGIIGESGSMEKRPNIEGRSLIVIFAPKK